MSTSPDSLRHPVRTYLGAPVSVGLVVGLDHLPDEGERAAIVSAARDAFDAEGQVEEGPGGFRWATPRVAVEVVRPEVDPQGPVLGAEGDGGSGTTGTGPLGVELRAGVHLANGELLPLLGVAVLGLNTLAALASALGLGPAPGGLLPMVAVNALLGTVLFVAGQLRARRWSRKARAQLDAVAAVALGDPVGTDRPPHGGGAPE